MYCLVIQLRCFCIKRNVTVLKQFVIYALRVTSLGVVYQRCNLLNIMAYSKINYQRILSVQNLHVHNRPLGGYVMFRMPFRRTHYARF